MARDRFRPRGGRGFSLVELLVVIGIIAVLLGILMPVLASSRRRAQDVACLANVRQLTQAYTMLAAQNKGRAPAFTFSSTDSWVEAFRDGMSTAEEAYLCAAVSGSVSPDFGTSQASWTLTLNRPGGPVQITGSYGFNAWLLRWDTNGRGGVAYSGGPRERYVTPASGGSSTTPVFADSTWMDGWPRGEDPTPPDLIAGDRSRQGPEFAPLENMMARFTIARHGRATNVSFLDGHAERVPVDDLKQLTWHQGFIKQAWSPPLPPK